MSKISHQQGAVVEPSREAFGDIMAWFEDVVGFDDHLEFLEHTIKTGELPRAVTEPVIEMCQTVRRRRADPRLYVAVIGEFSSGKSTFINALLRDDLLKTSVMVTTAAVTRIEHGGELDALVAFDDREPVSYRRDYMKLWRQIGQWVLGSKPERKNQSLRSFIHTTTSNESVSQHVTEATIQHPAAILSEGIVILDTPGCNAANRRHAAVTRAVVDQVADLAIIVIPATQPLSQSLAGFLAEGLGPYLHRCIFVVTMMDMIRPREQADLIDDIGRRLCEFLKLAQTAVYPVAPQVVLDILGPDAASVPKSKVQWSATFEDFENTMWTRVRRERGLTVAEALLRAMRVAFDQLGRALNQQLSAYTARAALLRTEVIQDLTAFSDEQHRECRDILRTHISSARHELEQCVAVARRTALDKTRQTVTNLGSREALDAFVANGAKQLLETHMASLTSSLQQRLEAFTRDVQAVGQRFDSRFSQQYARLSALGSNIQIGGDFRADSSIGLDSTAALATAREVNAGMDGHETILAFGGAGVGAFVGTLIFPGFGTAIGGAVGGWISTFFGPSIDERKEETRKKLTSSIEQQYDAARAIVAGKAAELADRAENGLQARIDLYIKKYRAVVEQMQKDQRMELARIQERQARTKSAQAELLTRQSAIERHKARFAALAQ